MLKLSDLFSRAKKALAPIGASHEARILAGRAFLMTDAELLLKKDEEIPKEQAERFWGMVEERLSGTPLQYILGEWEFLGLPIKVKKGVLIPRFDTEVVALRAIDWINENNAETALDLCCGSGCIAVAIAKKNRCHGHRFGRFSRCAGFNQRKRGIKRRFGQGEGRIIGLV